MRISIMIQENELSEKLKMEMWHLYQRYYAYSKQDFLKKMEKNNYYALYYYNDNLVGFTGLRINDIKIQRQNYFLLYFGQTVIDQSFRGQQLIQRTGTKLCLKFWNKLLFSKAIFWADTLTYKAYLVFAKSLQECYPSRKRQMPTQVEKVIDFIGDTHYPTSYNKKNRTVVKDINLVTDSTVQIKAQDRGDLDIQFFMKANPNYAIGHGLITLGPMNLTNLIFIMKNAINRVWKRIGRSSPSIELAVKG